MSKAKSLLFELINFAKGLFIYLFFKIINAVTEECFVRGFKLIYLSISASFSINLFHVFRFWR